MSMFEIQQIRNLSAEEEEGQQLAAEILAPEEALNYGNLIVFSRNLHLSLGPDYPFTIIALVFLVVISYALFAFAGLLSLGTMGKLTNLVFVLLPPVSFVYTALSNPGIYNCYQNDEPKIKYCETCKVFKPKKVFHCPRCNVCIEGFDHHCPWLSKCVGRKNIRAFYVLVLSIPAAFFYFGFMIYTAVTNKSQT